MIHIENYLEKFSLILLVGIFLSQVCWLIFDKFTKKNSDPKIIKLKKYFFSLIFVLAAVYIFGFETKEVFVSYFAWKIDPLSHFFLPPYRPISYFLIYALPRLIFPYLISLAFALMFWFLALFLNRKSSGDYFYPEEPAILALAIFLSGYPGFLIYLILFFIIFLVLNFVFTVINLFKKKKLEKMSPYFLWIPISFFAIILINWLSQGGYLIWFNL